MSEKRTEAGQPGGTEPETPLAALARQLREQAAAVPAHRRAEAMSAAESWPADFAPSCFQVSDSDLPASDGGRIVTPRDAAQRMISWMVWGPQLRAVDRCLKLSRRSRAVGGVQSARGGHSPISSVASIFSTNSNASRPAEVIWLSRVDWITP